MVGQICVGLDIQAAKKVCELPNVPVFAGRDVAGAMLAQDSGCRFPASFQRFMEGRAAPIFVSGDAVEVGAGLDQRKHDVSVAPEGSPMKRSLAPFVSGVDVRAARYQIPEDV